MRRTMLVVVALLATVTHAAAQDLCATVSGATVLADDGTYLGKIEGKFGAESIFNEFGTYGSKFSAKSIWNEFGTYGSKFSNQSPFNEFSRTPPAIVKRGTVIGYLSVSKTLRGAVSPYLLKTCEFI